LVHRGIGQHAAEHRPLRNQGDIFSAPGRRNRGRDAARTPADDENVDPGRRIGGNRRTGHGKHQRR
jgi:hypothetical protein